MGKWAWFRASAKVSSDEAEGSVHWVQRVEVKNGGTNMELRKKCGRIAAACWGIVRKHLGWGNRNPKRVASKALMLIMGFLCNNWLIPEVVSMLQASVPDTL